MDFGGFDERFDEAGEDNDLCYRWLRAGRRLSYEPELVVCHHDWRSSEQMRDLHLRYWRARGTFYAKHLRRRDPAVTRFLVRDLRGVLGVIARSALGRRAKPEDPRKSLARGLVTGFARGWRRFA
jgi:GT2 family glycosyltransferase